MIHPDINQSTGSLFITQAIKTTEPFNVERIKKSLPAFTINLYEGGARGSVEQRKTQLRVIRRDTKNQTQQGRDTM